MNVRLVKQKQERSEEKQSRPPDDNQVKIAVQDWIKEFKARKAEPASLDFRQSPAKS
jgi:hypothetical protein